MLVKHLIREKAENQEVILNGWIRSRRDLKDISFLIINDGSAFESMQVVLDHSKFETDLIQNLSTGASVSVKGKLKASEGKNQNSEVEAFEIRLIGKSPQDEYPLQKKRHSFEFLREIAHLRARTNTFGAVTRVRSRLSYLIHKFFQEEDFFYVHTPLITASDCEGAGEMFRVTAGAEEEEFFGRQAFLTVSGQLEGETYASAMGRIYTFGPTFRAENSNTSRHLSEFWMVEPEAAFYTLQENMELAQNFIKYLLSHILEDCRSDMEFFDSFIHKGLIDSLGKVASGSFTRISYTEAINELEKAKTDFQFTPAWGKDLQTEHEKYLTETVFSGPVIVYDYPKEIKSFYMKQNDDEKTVAAMDVLVPRLGEIIGGSEREYRLDRLETRMNELKLDRENYWWYLDLRKYGTVPHSGFGLGLERMVQYITAMSNIRDVIPFPRAPKLCSF